MKLQADELDGWVLERADFERLPSHGYLFYSDRRCYVCYPAHGARRMRAVLPRVVDLLARGDDGARRLRGLLTVAATEDA